MTDSGAFGPPSGPHTPSEGSNVGIPAPFGLTRRPRAGTMPSSLHLGPSLARPDSLTRRLSGMPASTSSHNDHESLPGSGASTPAETGLHHGPRPSASSSDLASLVFRSKPNSGSRLRSGSLVNLPSGGGVGTFGQGVFAGAWTPRQSNMSNQILEEIRSNESSIYGEEVRTLDYLGLDDANSSRYGQQDVHQVAAPIVQGDRASNLSAHASSPVRLRSNTVAGMPRREPLSRRHSPFAMGSGEQVAEEDEEEDGLAAYAEQAQQTYLASESGGGSYYSRALEDSTADHLGAGVPNAYLAPTSARPRASTIGVLEDVSPSAALRRRPPSSTGPSTPSEYPYGPNASGVVRAAPAEEPRILNGAFEMNLRSGAFDSPRVSTPERVRERLHEPSPPPQQPSRSLWIGNLDPKISTQDLWTAFSPYGLIESVRLLPDKECAFVNFVSIEDCCRAKADVALRFGSQLTMRQSGSLRLGFGKPESAPPPSVPSTPASAFNIYRAAQLASAQSSGADLQSSPTRALWVGSIPSATTNGDLLRIFSPFGAIESARVLTHKNCGFINFERMEDAVSAKKALNGKDILGADVGAIKIGFAKVPVKGGGTPSTPGRGGLDNIYGSGGAIAAHIAMQNLRHSASRPELGGSPIDAYRSNLINNMMSPGGMIGANGGYYGAFSPASAAAAAAQALQAATGTPSGASASALAMDLALNASIASATMPSGPELASLIRDLSGSEEVDAEDDVAFACRLRPSLQWLLSAPSGDELSSRLRSSADISQTRDVKKRLENGVTQSEADAIASELLDDCAALASDYIGNVIIQRLFERCSDDMKIGMLERIGPHLPTIGGHKNGTWAAQKIIECAGTPAEIDLICMHLRHHIPALLLGGFSNYVVQGVLRFGSPASDFVFDAMVDCCWEIGQGRFGARSMRTCLDHALTKRAHIKRVALAIIMNSIPLSTNPNGSLLLAWLLDTSGLPGRYRLLAPRLAPHLTHLCTHKLASSTVLRVINQKLDTEASDLLVKGLFDSSSQVLDDVLSDQAHGMSLVQKIISGPILDASEKQHVGGLVRGSLVRLRLQNVPAYKKLVDDLASLGLPVAGVEPVSSPPTPSVQGQPQTHLRPAFAFAGTPVNSPAGMPRADAPAWHAAGGPINAALLAQMNSLHLSPQRNNSSAQRSSGLHGSPAFNGAGTPINLGSHISFSPGPGSPGGIELYGGLPAEAYSPYGRGGMVPVGRPYGYWSG